MALSSTSFSLGTDDLKEEDIPEVPAEPVSRIGDVWLLGNHRIICGDATDKATVDRLLDGVQPHLMVSDPPYGVEYDPAWRNEAGASKTRRTGKVLNDDRADWRAAWALFPGTWPTSGMVRSTRRRSRKA